MATLRLRLLGQPLVWRDEQPVRFKTRKTLAAVAYLAVEGGLPSREQLAALLWPGHDLADARKNLRTALSYVHEALGAGALTTTHDAVSLDPSAPGTIDLDVRTLSRVQRLARASDGGEGRALRAQLEQAVALYRGPFLAGLDIPDAPEFESWLAGQRAHWLGVAGELLERLATLQAKAGDLVAARGTLERWVALEPGEERAWEHLLTLALEAGDLVGARRGWAACRTALAELGVAPGEPLQALAKRIHAAAQVAQPWPLVRTGQEAAWGGLGQAPLVGRAGPLAALRRAFACAQAGQTQLIVLQGEAGIGKTRLTREFLAWAQAEGAEVLTGRALAAEGGLPYAPLVAALRSRLERENAPEDLLGDLWLAELARLLPELRERYPDLPAATEDATLGQGRLFEAVAQLGQALAARGPLVLFLDDVQWADVTTRDLVRYTMRRWAEGGVRAVIVLAAQVDGVGLQPATEQWLASLEREAPTTRLELERLLPADVLHLVAALAGDAPEGESVGRRDEEITAFAEWLAGKTGGQPFFVIQMLQTLLDEGVLRLRPMAGGDWVLDIGGWARSVGAQGQGDLLPARVRALIAAQLARLDEAAAEVLAAGTVLGGSFSAEQVLQVAAVEERSGERALDQLVRGRLLREVPETGEYTVGHPLAREVLYAALGAARRRRLHQRALAVRSTPIKAATGAPADPSPNRAATVATKEFAERGDPARGPVFEQRAIADIRARDGGLRGRDPHGDQGVPVFESRQWLAHASSRRIRRALRRIGHREPVHSTRARRALPEPCAPAPRLAGSQPMVSGRPPAVQVGTDRGILPICADQGRSAEVRPGRTPHRGCGRPMLQVGAMASDGAGTFADRTQEAKRCAPSVARGERPDASPPRSPPPTHRRPPPAGAPPAGEPAEAGRARRSG